MIIVGHRGARNEAPENTLESFEHAYTNGCRHFELDVQLSKDQQLIVFHDTTLKRTTGLRGRPVNFSAQQLAKMDARTNTPGWPTPCGIPTLSTLVTALPDVSHWQFEVKSDRRFRLRIVAEKLIAFIKDFNLEGRATITSSNRWFLKEVKRNSTETSIGLVAESRFYDPVKAAVSLGCDYLCLSNALVTSKRIVNAKQQGLICSVWTVNDTLRMAELKSLDVDSVITDVPSLALKQKL
jgi:glycerophosphoryl diester phosphodiesterase